MCHELNIPYGTVSCKIHFVNQRDGKLQFKHYAWHGNGVIRSQAKDPDQALANRRAALKNKLKRKMSDCQLMSMGHAHQLQDCPPDQYDLRLFDNGEEIKAYYGGFEVGHNGYIDPHQRHYFCTGSFYKLYELGVSGYAERAGYDPVDNGFWVVKIRDRKIAGYDAIRL